MRCDVIDSTVKIYTGDSGEGRVFEDFGLLSLGRNLELEHTMTIDGYHTVCR
jgi:hypothetical protein